MMAGVRVVLSLLVPHDHRDRVGLDDQVLGQPSCLGGGIVRGRLVGVADRDQVGHIFLSFVAMPARSRPVHQSCRPRAPPATGETTGSRDQPECRVPPGPASASPGTGAWDRIAPRSAKPTFRRPSPPWPGSTSAWRVLWVAPPLGSILCAT